MTEVLVNLIIMDIKLIGKCLQVSADVLAGLVACHIVMVEIPIEMGLALLLEHGEELLLHLLDQVEADEEVMVVGERGILLV